MKEENITLDKLVGNWESINLNPTVIIYRSGDSYLLSVIHMNETSRQASPATYEIQGDEDGFFCTGRLYAELKDTAMEILDKKSTEIASFFTDLDELLDTIQQALKNRTPHLNGEKFLSTRDVCRMLHVSSRTLQEWRDTGKIPFIQIKGKILYRESEVLKSLEQNY